MGSSLKFFHLLTFASLLVVSACGREKYENFETYQPNPYTESGSNDNNADTAENPILSFRNHAVKFSCKKEDCRDGQAIMLSYDITENSIGACSSTLISKNLMLTNQHCIADSAGFSSLCPSVKFFYPKIVDENGSQILPAQSAHCLKIVSSSSNGKSTSTQDYAIIEIEGEIDRPLPKISLGGVEDGETLEYFSSMASMNDSFIFVRSEKHSCKTAMNNFIIPSYSYPTAPVIGLLGCNSVKGNSGSSLTNNRGETVALVQAGHVIGADTSSLAALTDQMFLESATPATNLSCVDPLQKGNETLRQSCQETLVRVTQESTSSLYAAWASQSGPVQDTDSFRFEWSWKPFLQKGSKMFHEIPYPKCFKNNRDWVKIAPTSGFLSSTVKFKLQFSKSYQIRFDANLRYSLAIDNSPLELEISFNKKEISNGGTRVLLKYGKTTLTEALEGTENIPQCVE